VEEQCRIVPVKPVFPRVNPLSATTILPGASGGSPLKDVEHAAGGNGGDGGGCPRQSVTEEGVVGWRGKSDDDGSQ